MDTHATTTSAHRSAAAQATLARASAAPALSANTQSASDTISKTEAIRSRLNRICDLPDLASAEGNCAATWRSRASSASAATASARVAASGSVGWTARPTAAAARADRLHENDDFPGTFFSSPAPTAHAVIARIAASTPSLAPFGCPRSARPTESAGVAASMISTAASGSRGCPGGDVAPVTAGNHPTGDGKPSVEPPSRRNRRSLPLATALATRLASSLAIPRSAGGYSPSSRVPAAAAKAARNAATAPGRSPAWIITATSGGYPWGSSHAASWYRCTASDLRPSMNALSAAVSNELNAIRCAFRADAALAFDGSLALPAG